MITGGLGFIGFNVLRRLRASYPEAEIHVFDKAVSYLDDLNPQDAFVIALRQQQCHSLARVVYGDIADRDRLVEAVRACRPTHVLHLAGVPLATSAAKVPDLAMEVNIEGTLNLLYALEASRASVQRLVFISSSFVYGNFVTDCAAEDHPLAPIDIYGATKLSGEILCRSYCQSLGVELVVARPSAVYGPYDTNHRVVQICVEAALAGQPLHLHVPNSPLDFTFVEDLADGLIRALLVPDAAGRTFNLTGGKGRTLEELAAILGELIPGVMVEYGPAPLNRPKRGTLDISHARERLGYYPHHRLESGLARYVAFSRKVAASFAREAPPREVFHSSAWPQPTLAMPAREAH